MEKAKDYLKTCQSLYFGYYPDDVEKALEIAYNEGIRKGIKSYKTHPKLDLKHPPVKIMTTLLRP